MASDPGQSTLPLSAGSRSSVVASGGKRYRPKVLRKASELPGTFPGGRTAGGVSGDGAGDGGGGVRGCRPGGSGVAGGERSVGGNVGGGGRVTGSASGGTGRGSVGGSGGGSGGGMGGEGGCGYLTERYLTTHPGAGRFEGSPGPIVIRVRRFEIREDVLGAVRGPNTSDLWSPLSILILRRALGNPGCVNM